MSLLIKALDKAQAEKAQTKKDAKKARIKKTSGSKAKPTKQRSPRKPNSLTPDLSLAPAEAKPTKVEVEAQKVKPNQTEKVVIDRPAVRSSASERTNSPVREQAANVFAAKGVGETNSVAKLAIVIGAIALALLAAIAYWYQTNINTPDVSSRPALVQNNNQEMPKPLSTIDPLPEEVAEVTLMDQVPVEPLPEVVQQEALEPLTPASNIVEEDVTPEPEVTAVFNPEPIEQTPKLAPSIVDDMPVLADTLTVNEAVIEEKPKALADMNAASDSTSISLTKQKNTSDVNPILMRAYEAYNAGEDRQASQDYKEVLKLYGPNVDAMLGLGAIAARQGRSADANGWYQKVLEIEPRNEIAKSGVLGLQQSAQPQASESSIKSMLATAPTDANLHAALGDLYASRNEWSAAQQAYFDAYRLSQSAGNALNLGVSLDQMAKPKLALPYYQEALERANSSNAIDVEAIKARILSIE